MSGRELKFKTETLPNVARVSHHLVKGRHEASELAFLDTFAEPRVERENVRPDGREQVQPLLGDEDLARAHVARLLPPADDVLLFQRVERPAHSGLLGHGKESKLVHGDAGCDRQHRQRPELGDDAEPLEHVLQSGVHWAERRFSR